MTPAQEFRLSARRAPTGERVSAAIAIAVVVVLLVWLVAPGGGKAATNLASSGNDAGNSSEASLQGGATGGTAGQTGTGGGAVSGGSAATGGSTGSGAPAATANGNAAAAGGAVTLTNIVGPAANSIFGIAPPADQQSWYTAVIDDINKNGGVGCRKIVPTFYPTNPADQNELQQRCLQIVQSGVF